MSYRITNRPPAVAVGILALLVTSGSLATAGELPGKVTGGGSIPPGFECPWGGSCAQMVIESASKTPVLVGSFKTALTLRLRAMTTASS